MVSSSERGAAHQATGAPPPPLPPPPPEELAAFYALVEKLVTATVLCRHTRAVELSERGAQHAEKLWGEYSLVVAHLRVNEAISLRGMANASTSSSEQDALSNRAWAILVPVHALLLRRLADNTLLPGTIKEEEVTYDARSQAFMLKAKNKPIPSEAFLQGLGVTRGYETLLDALHETLCLLVELRGSALPRESAHSFVLTALDAIPRTAAMQNRLVSEANLVAMMEIDSTSSPPSVLRCSANGAQVMWLKCCARVTCCSWAFQQPKRVVGSSKPADVPTSRRLDCESARGRPATR